MSDSGGSFGGRAAARGAGGTPGGVGEFFLGLLLAGIGTYLLLTHVQVQTGFWHLWGTGSSFGVSLIPMLIGVGALFFNGKSVIGWVLAVGGFLFILVGIVANLDVYFQRTTLLHTLIMLGLMAAGLGLVFRSLRAH
jgi:hypothetical protein